MTKTRMNSDSGKRLRRLGVVLVVAGALAGCSSLPPKVQEFGRSIGAYGVQFGSLVSSTFSKLLNKKDQEQMGSATVEAAETGQSKDWKSADSNTKGSARVVETQTETKQVKVKVLKTQVKNVPPLDFIDQTYTATKRANVRGGPGTDFVTVGSLAGGTKVTVVGKVKDKPWFLVSQDGVGRGFVHDSLLKQSPEEVADSSGTTVSDADVKQQAVVSERVCKTIEQSVVLADGTEKSETVRACKGPNGWELSPSV